MSSSIFMSSVSEAVSASVASSKPMAVYLTDGSSAAEQWGSLLFLSDPEIATLLQQKAVALKLYKPSQEFDFFTQIFPNPVVPSVYFIKTGQLLDIAAGEISIEEFKQKLSKIFGDSAGGAINTATTMPNTAENTPANNTIPPQSESTTPVLPQPDASSPANRPDASRSQSSESRPQLPKPESPAKKHHSKKPEKKYESLRQQIAEESALYYKKERLRQKKLAKQDKERILNLVKADQKERQKQRQSSQNQKSTTTDAAGTSTSSLNATGNTSHSHHGKHNHPTCVLSIRLLDGSRVIHEFKSSDNLNTVREWVDNNRLDGDQPYVFYEAVIRKTYTIGEENTTLAELDLLPRSALILKPQSNYTSAYTTTSSESYIGKAINAVYSIFGNFATTNNNGDAQPRAPAVPAAAASLTNLHNLDRNSREPLPIVGPATDFSGRPFRQYRDNTNHDNTSSTSIDQINNTGNNSNSGINDRQGSSSPFLRSTNVSTDDLNSFYSSSSHVNSSITSLSDLNNSRFRSFADNSKDKDKKVTYNGNQTNLEDDPKNKHD